MSIGMYYRKNLTDPDVRTWVRTPGTILRVDINLLGAEKEKGKSMLVAT
jgi:hypothetical protein